MSNEEFGLPEPKDYDGEVFTAYDYASERFADARTLEEAIELRGHDAHLQELTPDDFLDEPVPGLEKLGIAELWAESTWELGWSDRAVSLEQLVSSIKEGDLIRVLTCSEGASSEWGYSFCLPDGTLLPYSPYHDYDDIFFEKALEGLREGEWLECRVRETSCYGGDGVPHDPCFCWRVYPCKVMVYRGGRSSR